MRTTAILYRKCVRLTLFTRPNCSLCDDAKEVLSRVWDRKPFEYDEIDVMKQQKWKDIYEFDTPVVHFDKTEENNHRFETSAAARKLMHRFTEQDVDSAIVNAFGKDEESCSRQ